MKDENKGFSIGAGGSKGYPSKEEFDRLAEKQTSDIKFIFMLMVGIIVFVVVTFLIEVTCMNLNYIQDKTILLQYNQQNKDYFDKVLLLNNEIQDMKIKSEVLKAKNPYLK
ncbi:hypothetical protein M0R01_02830 [bacterium]|nr:hypothetical protein [bacterium]